MIGTDDCGDASHFENTIIFKKDDKMSSEIVLDTSDVVLRKEGTTEGNTIVDTCEYNEPRAMPSGGESCEPVKRESKMYAAVGRQGASQNVKIGTECETIPDDIKNECVFKKGGMCKIHQVKGEKIVTKTKEWVKKKNGLFGYVSKQQTTYRCSRRAAIVGQPSPTKAGDTRKELDSGLRLGENLPGDNLRWDCGVDLGRAGAYQEKSESIE